MGAWPRCRLNGTRTAVVEMSESARTDRSQAERWVWCLYHCVNLLIATFALFHTTDPAAQVAFALCALFQIFRLLRLRELG